MYHICASVQLTVDVWVISACVAVVRDASVNMGVDPAECLLSVLLCIYPQWNYRVTIILFNFSRNCQIVFHRGTSFDIPNGGAQGFRFLHIFANIYYLVFMCCIFTVFQIPPRLLADTRVSESVFQRDR